MLNVQVAGRDFAIYLEEIKILFKILKEKPRSLRRTWQDNIKTRPRQIAYTYTDWNKLA